MVCGTRWVRENKRLLKFKWQLAELEAKQDKSIDDYKDIAELIGRIHELTRFTDFIDHMLGD